MISHPGLASVSNGSTLLIQLPIPQLNFGRQTGNIPLGAACLKMAADAAGAQAVGLVPESIASYLGDAALLDVILTHQPDIVGFSVYAWNLDRSLHLARQLKSHAQTRVVFGGPEVTPDNPRVHSPVVDFHVYGEGEAIFAALLQNPDWTDTAGSANADMRFEQGHNPYLAGLLEPQIENMILVETQRGCPHRCGYCFYGKSRHRLSTVPAGRVIETVGWARDQGIAEVYLLDPCLNSRKDLNDLLVAIARVNKGRQVKLISEIRAEAVSNQMAARFAEAGFTWFEIGLQSTTPAALRIMNRPTDLKAFVRGTRRLKKQGIRMGIDLIAGLPGDDPAGFSRSVNFVIENGLAEDAQVFPLSILPGTPFKKSYEALGLEFDPHPPYTVVKTPTFSRQAITDALNEAQERFDLCLYPFPDLDLSGCIDPSPGSDGSAVRQATVSGIRVITKILINQASVPSDIKAWSHRLAHPYQIVFGPPATGEKMICKVIRKVTTANPFTPLEIVWVEPKKLPDIQLVLAATQLRRPHYLDMDLAFLYLQPGNRAVLFTLLSTADRLHFQGEMQRQVRWWTRADLPTQNQLEALENFDGIFIPDTFERGSIRPWQDAMAPLSHELPAITFGDPAAHKRWVKLTMADDYWLDLLPSG